MGRRNRRPKNNLDAISARPLASQNNPFQTQNQARDFSQNNRLSLRCRAPQPELLGAFSSVTAPQAIPNISRNLRRAHSQSQSQGRKLKWKKDQNEQQKLWNPFQKDPRVQVPSTWTKRNRLKATSQATYNPSKSAPLSLLPPSTISTPHSTSCLPSTNPPSPTLSQTPEQADLVAYLQSVLDGAKEQLRVWQPHSQEPVLDWCDGQSGDDYQSFKEGVGSPMDWQYEKEVQIIYVEHFKPIQSPDPTSPSLKLRAFQGSPHYSPLGTDIAASKVGDLPVEPAGSHHPTRRQEYHERNDSSVIWEPTSPVFATTDRSPLSHGNKVGACEVPRSALLGDGSPGLGAVTPPTSPEKTLG